ncbi:unnamed protein product [Tilletia laevis]|uniref:Tryptophan synthase n=2 Tax=Tilletia TaxID=13289 RepID=A0A177VAD3_9BASI|nr:hypothetical protein CF335_g7197 [Tilletia laevis]KAE8253787.1 hypothetical protein A4X03_0g5808 [Tilletia caries]CAD6937859.1 unnamed protein product [Tilletia controversa]CAD6889856.1 unnamed protein product [Tilletia caries]CAD6952969.1 unnamed protein product [Tilletia caries]
MTSQLNAVFEKCKAARKPAFIAYTVAGHPTKDATVDIMLALERGGADIIELGVPFSDPQADGPTIQAASTLALKHNTSYSDCLGFVKDARERGLKAAVVLMGYFNPLLAYGEERAIADAADAGANGFIVVDLPPDEAGEFAGYCDKHQVSFVPLVAPSTSDKRLSSIMNHASSWVYVVSKMGTTGSAKFDVTNIPPLLSKIRNYTPNPLCVGFNVASFEDFRSLAEAGAQGIVVGSAIVRTIEQAYNAAEGGSKAQIAAGADAAEKLAAKITGKDQHYEFAAAIAGQVKEVKPDGEVVVADKPTGKTDAIHLGRFGTFGGAFVSEALVDAVNELDKVYTTAINDSKFWDELKGWYEYIGRPSTLYEATRLTEHAGGARIWLKREDLNHTGSHKINNAIGQLLIARRIGKTRIITETGAGQHGVATATACARFGMECVVYMGSEDVRRQSLNVFRMRMLGAKVIPVESGSKTLKDAVNEAMRDWVTNLESTHYLLGSVLGPHPFPRMIRDLQRVIGKEIKAQLLEKAGKLPDAIVACVGGGSNAIGTFYDFIEEEGVRLIGVEAGGDGVDTERHSATLTKGSIGVLHGARMYLLQSKEGQITETHSISAGLDYPGVGPEHCSLKEMKRAEYMAATDVQALGAFRLLTEKEGIIPALESAHAIYGGVELAKTMSKDKDIVITLSGRGDKDVQQIYEMLSKEEWRNKLDWHLLE